MTTNTAPETPSQADTSTANTVTWWELPVESLDGGQRFYGAVFGWTYTPFGEGYVGIYVDGTMIGGMFEQAGQPANGPRLYVQVDDIEATLAAVQKLGGSIKTERSEVGGDMGWWAELTDPTGRDLGICSGNPAAG